MLDVHPPHAPTHTWKDFFIHIATICVGLLIAIGLEQTVEAIHRAHERAELRRALGEESVQIVYDTSRSDEDDGLQLVWVVQQEASVDQALRSHHALGPIPPPPRLAGDVAGAGNPYYVAAKASGRIGLLTDQEVVAYGELNDEVQLIDPRVEAYHKAMRAFSRQARAFESETKDPNLSPDATGTRLVALRSALVELEDALRDDRFANRASGGAATALSKGELDLKKVEAAEMQAIERP
jgi:hypothetical protein